tara:strand:- start:432 stop:701 length:270 start_codon:yes stop_codon:yes gene_type:complete
METQIINDMWKVDELIYSFRNVLCLDDEKELEDYSNDEILCEANYILSCYYEYGHINNFMLIGENGKEEKATATKEVKQLRKFINKWSK